MDDSALFFDPDSTDDLCISYEAFEQILNEEPVPPQTYPSGIPDGFHQCEAPVQVNFEKALQNQPGMLESSTLIPEHIEQTSTRWDSSDYMDPTYFKKESSSGFHFGSEGCFNNLSDICHPLSIYGGNLPAVQYADSNYFPSLPLNHSSEWLRLSSSKENTCLRGSVGGSFDGLNIGTFDYQQLQNNIVKCCASSGDTKEKDFFNSPCASHINGLYLDCVGGNGSLQMGGENSFQMGVKHSALDVTNNSSPFLFQNGGKVQKGRLCGALSLSSSLDPDATLPGAILAVKKTSEATDSMCNAADSCLTLPRDFATEVDKGSRQILPTPFFQSFLLKKEAILNGKDNHGLQQLLQNSCMTSEAKLGTQEDSLGNYMPNVSQIDSDASLMNELTDEQKHYGDMSSKSESSTDSSPIPSSRNSTSNNTDSSIGNPGKFMVSDSALKFPSKKQKTVSGDKMDQVSALFHNQHSLSRGSYDSIQRNQWRSSLRADADADICVLDDISDPACLPAPVVRPKLQPMLQRSEFSDLYYRGSGDMRLKSDDERLTFQIALQDLSPPKSEANPPDGVLAVPLLRHQRIALSWMVQKETNSLQCSGGILADDQGLGKTISTIALILTERSPSFRSIPTDEKPDEFKPLNLDDDDDVSSEIKVMEQPLSFSSVMMSGPIKRENYAMVVKGRPAAGTLVVCPTSVLRQWAEELKCKVNGEANLTFLIYHGSKRTRDPEEIAKYDVVLTTYAIVSMEVPKQPLVDKDDEKVTSGLVNSKKRKISPNLTIKNQKNALAESSARPLAKVGWFRVILDEAQCIKNHKAQVARACWGLRAKRRWCLSGTPIQNAVDDLYSYFRFLRYDPYAVYKSFCSTIKMPISRNPTNGYKKLQAVLKTIMLRRTKGTLLDGKPIINLPPKTIIMKKVEFSREERSYYSTLEAESREQFQEYAAAGTVKQNYGNILLMLLRLRQTCDHPLLVKKGCDTNSIGKSSYEMAKKFPREKQISLLSCFEASVAICTICKDAPEDAVVTICGHVFCDQCIREHLTGDDCICPSVHCKVTLSAASVFSRVTLERCLSGPPDYDNHSRSVSDMGGPPTSENSVFSSSSKINAALEILGSLPRSHPPSKFITEKLNGGCIGSPENAVRGVIPKCSMDISERKYSASDKSSNAQATEKAIVFSQWTRMLDLMEIPLKDSCIQYRRLDGTMSVAAREKAIREFNTLPEVTVMIMSLKAASLGLNMVAACHVLLLDLWWNPTTEDQAIDRAHRIGQTRPVIVSRLTVKDTVEDRILALQEKKRVMVASAFGEDESGTRQTRLTVDELKYLFMA